MGGFCCWFNIHNMSNRGGWNYSNPYPPSGYTYPNYYYHPMSASPVPSTSQLAVPKRNRIKISDASGQEIKLEKGKDNVVREVKISPDISNTPQSPTTQASTGTETKADIDKSISRPKVRISSPSDTTSQQEKKENIIENQVTTNDTSASQTKSDAQQSEKAILEN